MPKLDSLWWELEARYDKLDAGLNQAKTRLASFAAFVVGSPAKALAAFGAAVVLIGVAAAKMAEQFDASMRRAIASMPGAVDKLDELKRRVLELSERLPVTAEQLAAGMRKVADISVSELGTDVEALAGRLELAARTAYVTGQDIGSVVETIDTALDAFGQTGNAAAKTFVDLVYGASNTFVSFQELGSMISRVGVFAANAGVPLEELAAYIVAVAERGVPARMAMMGLRRAFNDTSIAEGETAESTVKAGDMLGQLGLKVRVADGHLQGLVTTTDTYRTSLHNATEGASRFTAAEELLTGGAEAQARMVRQQLNAAMIEFGTRTLPIVTAELRGIVGLLDLLSGRVGDIKLDSAATTMNVLAAAVERFRRAGRDVPEGVLQRLADAAGQVSRAMGPMGQASTAALQGLHRALAAAGDVNLATILKRQELEAELARRGAPLRPRGAGITPITITGAPPRARTAAEEAAATTRAQALTELRDRVSEMMGDAYAITVRQLDAIEAQWRKTYGTDIPAEMTAGMAKLRAAALGDQAVAAFGGKLDELVEKTRALTESGHGTTEEYQAQLAALAEMRDALQVGLQDTTLSAAAHERIRGILTQIAALERQVLAAKKGQASASKVLLDHDRLRLERLQAQARNIEAAARGALQLARAFGMVDENTARALENVVQIAANIPALVAAIAKGSTAGILGAGLAVAGGLAGLAQGLFGKREESPEEKARKEAMERNTLAIQELALRIGDFGLNITGRQFAGVRQGVGAFLSGATQPGRLDPRSGRELPEIMSLTGALAAAGVTMAELRKVAEELGIAFQATVPTAAELKQLLDAINATELARFTETFAGQMDALRAEFELFDITDPIQQLEKLRGTMSAFSPAIAEALAGLDLLKAEDRATLEARLQAILRSMQAGTLTPEQLGNMTAQQLLDAILQLEGTIDQANQGATAGVTQQWGVNRTITEATASRQLSLMTTMAYWLAIIGGDTGVMAGRLAPPDALELAAFHAGASAGGLTVGELSITVQVTVGAGADGQAIGQAVGAATAEELNRQLYQLAQRRARALGQATLQ